MSQEKEMPDLLPWDFAPQEVLAPESILKHQAELIGQKSGGRLRGEVERTEAEEDLTLGLLVVAPLLDYAVRLLSCRHQRVLPYPTTVYSDAFSYPKYANVENEFRKLIKEVLASNYARSVFQSLIARIGDRTDESEGTANENVDEPESGAAPE